MAKIAEIQFEPRGKGFPPDCRQAQVHFANGYGASVLTGSMFYSRPERPYEIAVMVSDGTEWVDGPVYDTPVTDDVLGYLTEAQADAALAQIEALPAHVASAA